MFCWTLSWNCSIIWATLVFESYPLSSDSVTLGNKEAELEAPFIHSLLGSMSRAKAVLFVWISVYCCIIEVAESLKLCDRHHVLEI